MLDVFTLPAGDLHPEVVPNLCMRFLTGGCPQFCPQYRRHTMTRDHTRRAERHGPNRADDTFRHLLYSDEHGRLGLRNRQSWTFESPNGNGPQMTTVLTTTPMDNHVQR